MRWRAASAAICPVRVTEPKPLACKIGLLEGQSSNVAARSIHAVRKAKADRIDATDKHDRDRGGADLLQYSPAQENGANDHTNLALGQIGQFGG